MSTSSHSIASRSPSKASEDKEAVERLFRRTLARLCPKWDLQLEFVQPGILILEDSPQHSLLNLKEGCYRKIRFLCWEIKKGGQNRIDACITKFDAEAEDLYSDWVKKAFAEPGVIPKSTRQSPRPLNDRERTKWLERLLEILQEGINSTPKRSRAPRLYDDDPIPIDLKSSRRPKRPSDDIENESHSKKSKQPDVPSNPNILRRKSENAQMPPLERGRLRTQEANLSRSANTSFASNTSTVFSVQYNGDSNFHITQETIPDDDDESEIQTEPNTRPSSVTRNNETHQSSEYEGGSSFEARVREAVDANGLILGVEKSSNVDNELSQGFMDVAINPLEDAESLHDILQDRLKGVFPALPRCLKAVPLCVKYEITRVFLNVNVPLDGQDLTNFQSITDYDKLWSDLENIPALRGKTFPEQCGKEVWAAALDNFQSGSRGVIMAGSLQYSHSDPSNPFFIFRLKSMKLDQTHRLSRRYGNDRFLEIDMPHLSGGRDIPGIMQALGEEGLQILLDWLVDGSHQLCGRSWKPFHTKPKERKERRWETHAWEREMQHRVYFFATHGDGFQAAAGLPDPRNPLGHVNLRIHDLLDFIRPIRKNKGEKYLKLFARTSLAVSRNSATIELSKDTKKKEISEILYEDDIRYNGEVMSDGAGRMSYSLAQKITKKLGLSYTPSGFQGRIGEAKGFWTVDYNDKSARDWIKIFESQQKWKYSSVKSSESYHPLNRTFEVLRFSGPLKSADLNLQFLPLLTDRAKNPQLMQRSLSRLLEIGLERVLDELQTAMEDPISLRKWLRDNNPNITEKLKNKCVPYRASLPVTTEERLNMLLDAGFEPRKSAFVKDLARKALKNKCDDLKKRLNITVGKSTYAYMVPDFEGVLEPGEVYIDFSSFIDDSSGFSGVLLNGVDVLVARSPAHYVSDIQKVKVVFKVELMGMKDVIVFSTKGNPSLAEKLSGGDYDGDIAWVCWEESLVNNFESADVEPAPNLVEDGYIHQIQTTYRELASQGKPNEGTSVFLKESFKFNMQQNLLGICTVFKESIVYHQEKVDTRESRYLSTLLSNLVDQAKQGYLFTEGAWARLKDNEIKIKPFPPAYKDGNLVPKSKNIIDQLMIVAHKTVESALTQFENSIKDASFWDEDLAKRYIWARELAKTSPELNDLLDKLDEDINAVKNEWKAAWGRSFSKGKEDENNEYMSKVDRCFKIFQVIEPCLDTPAAKILLESCLPDQNESGWALLRASALFSSYRGHQIGNFVWFMAGKQLARLKSQQSGGGSHAVIPSMYVLLKPDAAYAKRCRAEGGGQGLGLDENGSVVNAEEIDDLED